MSLDATLRLLTKASGLTAADLAAAIPRAGVSTVKAWLAGEKMPGSEQLNALARAFGVPAGALLSELASTLDPARTQGEHDLLAAYRALNTRQQGALLLLVGPGTRIQDDLVDPGAEAGQRRRVGGNQGSHMTLHGTLEHGKTRPGQHEVTNLVIADYQNTFHKKSLCSLSPTTEA